MKNQKVYGVIIAYLTTILQIVINIVFTPFLIKTLGTSEYGLYQTISSFANGLTIMNLGIAAIMSRNVIKFRVNEDDKGLQNFLCISTIITFIVSVGMLVMGIILSFSIDNLYGSSLSLQELKKAKYMFIYLVFNLAVIVWNNMFSGISVGYEKFVFSNSLKLFRQVIRVLILYVLLRAGKDSVAIVLTDLYVSLFLLLIELCFCILELKIKIRFHYFDKALLVSILTFSLASLLQTITTQINLSIDKVVLGVMTTTKDVSIYSIALLILTTMISITKVVGSVYLPEATRLVLQEADGETLTNLVIKPGRIQNILGCGIFFGFIVLGRDFLAIWMGEDFVEVWLSTVILILPVVFTCVTTVANTIIDAMMKKMARSLILLSTAVLNLLVTIIAVKIYGYVGAAIATAISVFFGEIIGLNLYYKKVIKINIYRMYKEIFSGIFQAALLSGIISGVLSLAVDNSIKSFSFRVIVFIGCYMSSLWLFGLNSDEKSLIINKIAVRRKARS